MPPIAIYTTALCPYCIAAKRLLSKKNLKFNEIRVDGNDSLRAEMRERAGGINTVPQIWIGDQHIGGCNELYELEDDGKLDELLAA